MEVTPIILSVLKVVSWACLAAAIFGYWKLDRIREEWSKKQYEYLLHLYKVVERLEAHVGAADCSISLLKKEVEELRDDFKRIRNDAKDKDADKQPQS